MEKIVRTEVKLVTIKDLVDFVRNASTIEGDVLVTTESGKVVVDGKSLLGLMSLNLLRPIIISYPAKETYFTEFLSNYIYGGEH